jgi:hypothetical protein
MKQNGWEDNRSADQKLLRPRWNQKVRHWTLPWISWIQPKISHAIYLRLILILSFHLWLDLTSDLSLLDHTTEVLIAFHFSHKCITSSSHHFVFNYANNIWYSVQVITSSSCNWSLLWYSLQCCQYIQYVRTYMIYIQIIWSQIVRRLINDKLEKIWKEAVVD